MTKQYLTSKTLWVNLVLLLATFAQGQFGFIIDPETQISLLVVINMLLRVITGEELVWNKTK